MNKIERKTAIPIDELMRQLLKTSGLGAGHNTRVIFQAWDNASGAAQYTLRRYFKDGKLYITLNNSVVRGQLFFQKDVLLEKVNRLLEEDPMFIRDDAKVGFVKELILK